VRLGDGGPLLAVGRDLRAVGAIQQRFLEAQKDLERDYWQRRNVESRYRMLFQVANDAVLVLDATDGGVLEANPAAGALFGQPQATWSGLPLRAYVDGAMRPALDELLLTARSTGRAAEVRLRTAADGAALDVSATPFRAEGRRCLLVRARRAEASAGDAPGVLDFIGQTPDAVVVTDVQGRVQWANPAFVELCQEPQEDHVKGRLLAEVLGDPQLQWQALLARVRARGIIGRATVQLQLAGMPLLNADVSATLLDEGDQECVGLTLRPVAGPPAPFGWAQELALEITALEAQLGRCALPDLLAEASRRVESHLIQAAIRAAAGRLDVAAAALRIGTDTLLLRMGRLGVPVPAPSGREGMPPTMN
jgi:transcriptional regulator PpsR